MYLIGNRNGAVPDAYPWSAVCLDPNRYCETYSFNHASGTCYQEVCYVANDSVWTSVWHCKYYANVNGGPGFLACGSSATRTDVINTDGAITDASTCGTTYCPVVWLDEFDDFIDALVADFKNDGEADTRTRVFTCDCTGFPVCSWELTYGGW